MTLDDVQDIAVGVQS